MKDRLNYRSITLLPTLLGNKQLKCLMQASIFFFHSPSQQCEEICADAGQEDKLAAPHPRWNQKQFHAVLFIYNNKTEHWTGFFCYLLFFLHEHMLHSICPVRMTHTSDFPLMQLCSWTQDWANNGQYRQQRNEYWYISCHGFCGFINMPHYDNQLFY